MAREDVKARIRLEGDAKGATKAIAKTEKGFKRLTSSIKKASLLQVAAYAGVALAIRGAARAIGEFVSLANKQAEAVNALDGALADLGPSADGVSEALQRQASALQSITRFGDEEIIQAQALIGSFVKEQSAIEAATKAALDLAEAKGFSLVTAADLISKTLGSSTNALTRYGIEVTGAVGSTERLATLTGNLAKAFGGRAQKATETFSGKMTQLSNSIGDMKEAIGEGITASEDLAQGVDDLRGNVEDLTPAVAELSTEMVEFGIAAVNAFVDATKRVGDFILLLEGNDLVSTMEDGAIATGVLRTRAFELGITVEELQLKLKLAVHENRVFGTEAKIAAKALEAEEAAAAAAAKATAKLAEETKEGATAMEKLAGALDLVTASELAQEIVEIEEALRLAREETGGFGLEFENLERVAAEKIDSITARMVNLSDGFGDVGKSAAETTEAVKDFARETIEAGIATDDLAANLRLADSGLQATARNAVFTSRAFDELAKAAGRAAAVSAAIDSGGELSQGGTRIRLPGGGSRLVNTSGRGSISYSLSEFGTGGKAKVNPNGSLRPA